MDRSIMDRFIPSRYATNFELSHYKIFQQQNNVDKAKQNGDKIGNISPAKREMQRLLAKNLICVDNIYTARVLAYQIKKPSKENLNILCGQTETSAVNIKDKMHSTKYPQILYKTLDIDPHDAKDISFINNNYLNFMDGTWSPDDILVAISDIVYVWDTTIRELDDFRHFLKIQVNGREVRDAFNYISSVAWNKRMLAVGTTKGTIEIWKYSYENMERIRFLNNQDTSRVNCLSWYSSDILTSGSRSGKIQHHDIRQPDHSCLTINAHYQEVCGLKWSPDGQYLASGGRDNILRIWPSITRQNNHQPIYSLNKHQSAIKALAWCPWQNNILASGGIDDQTIIFWNVNTGNCFRVNTKSQVCALVWSPNYKEIISGHGKPQNQLTVWKYPSMAKIADLKGHTDRVSYLSMSPDGTTIFSASTDKTQKLWYCAEMDPLSMRKKLKNNSSLLFKQCIR